MALDPNKLKQLLLQLSQSPPQTPQEAGRRWASAYAAYAADAVSPMGGSPIGLDPGEAVLGNLLGITFATSRDPNTTAQAYATGFTAFWFVPPVAFTGTPPGVVTLVGGTAALAPALLSVWASNLAGRLREEQAMQAIAAVLDTFTRTVIVTHPVVPTPVVGPIS